MQKLHLVKNAHLRRYPKFIIAITFLIWYMYYILLYSVYCSDITEVLRTLVSEHDSPITSVRIFNPVCNSLPPSFLKSGKFIITYIYILLRLGSLHGFEISQEKMIFFLQSLCKIFRGLSLLIPHVLTCSTLYFITMKLKKNNQKQRMFKMKM